MELQQHRLFGGGQQQQASDIEESTASASGPTEIETYFGPDREKAARIAALHAHRQGELFPTEE